MGVDIQVHNPHPFVQKMINGKHRIVDIAKAGGPIRKGMVKPARDIEGDADAALSHLSGTLERSPGVKERPFPEPGEHGIVTRTEAVGIIAFELSPACLLQHFHVTRRMESQQILFLCSIGLSDSDIGKVEQPIRSAQLMGEG
jgi:hypothetical protein